MEISSRLRYEGNFSQVMICSSILLQYKRLSEIFSRYDTEAIFHRWYFAQQALCATFTCLDSGLTRQLSHHHRQHDTLIFVCVLQNHEEKNICVLEEVASWSDGLAPWSTLSTSTNTSTHPRPPSYPLVPTNPPSLVWTGLQQFKTVQRAHEVQ